jgi:hypothetical protein
VLRSTVSRCVSAAGIRFLGTLARQTEFRPPYGRPTAHTAHTRARAADPGRFSTFHTHETQTGSGAVYTPRTAVLTGHLVIRDRRLPPHNGRSLFTPAPLPNPGCPFDEASSTVS